MTTQFKHTLHLFTTVVGSMSATASYGAYIVYAPKKKRGLYALNECLLYSKEPANSFYYETSKEFGGRTLFDGERHDIYIVEQIFNDCPNGFYPALAEWADMGEEQFHDIKNFIEPIIK